MFAGLPTELSKHVGGSEGCGLERQAWRQWARVCGGQHSGQSPVMTPWKEGQGGLKARGCRKNRWSGWHERESGSGTQGVRGKKESGTCVSSLREWRI